ncbi:hypothetical protein SAMN05216436_10671 [bacterium A37T11]|nr:hypothetical protein SAMN05216436_10671 [bacterium A37T11]
MDTVNTKKISHPVVKAAIDALQAGDKKAWFALFAKHAEFYDDGRRIDFQAFFGQNLGHERFTHLDKIADGGLMIYGRFHSDQWGDFKTYFKFYLDGEDKIYKLEIGQATY